MMEYLGYAQQEPTVIFEDNTACIVLSQDPIHACRTKHIDLRRMYLKELCHRQVVRLVAVKTEFQHADFLTKSLPADVMQFHYNIIRGHGK